MKLLSLIVAIQVLLSCNNSNSSPLSQTDVTADHLIHTEDSLNRKFTVAPDLLLKDFTTWYNYTYNHVRLSQDFTGLDTDSSVIDKSAFLNKLLTDDVVAFQTEITNGKPVYRLYKLTKDDKDIKTTSQQLASIEMRNYRMEGKQLPGFNFTDINGNNYTTASTKGKYLVIKCWFIRCAACVREFPQCNELVENNKDRNDILFISLANDSKDELTNFLKKKSFSFATVPGMDAYMTSQLHIVEYPTILLADKTGQIIKVTNSVEDLAPFVKKT